MTETAGRRALVFDLLETYCSRKGFRLTAGDSHGHAGMVESPSGKRWFFKGTRFDLNTLGAAEIATDKAYAAAFLKAAGLAVPDGRLVFARDIRKDCQLPRDLLDFAEQHGFPLFVKPNCGREGRDVLRVNTLHAFQDALSALAERNDQLLVQPEIRGQELRIVVLDGEVLCAIERRPPQITGDGLRSIAELIGADVRLEAVDPRLNVELSQQGLTLEAIPAPGQTVTLLPVVNLSAGGTARIVTGSLGPELAALARKAAQALALRYAAVDLILPDAAGAEADAIVLEVNAAPGLGNLARQGSEESAAVHQIYDRVFETMFAG
ncbi:ATP-dependent carboxylate-amine ligase [Roseibium sp. FZY0029]|uniref:ATP-dependent carboxylate-amine ligase n=1 Tax=Roseibium sp. FZY0029 TaxID=3116647 RepID=UPI002EB67924|nr:ATP-dependent carboxylate-amine ligase [Roseibium sp. FZY0029]